MSYDYKQVFFTFRTHYSFHQIPRDFLSIYKTRFIHDKIESL